MRPITRLPEGLRRAVRRRIPGWAWYRWQRATSYLQAPPDPAPLARIASEPAERLRDADFLTAELLPGLGLTSHGAPTLFPAHLQPYVGTGVQSIQYPNQFGPYLAALCRARVESYLEVGVEHGGTFAITVEVLRRFGLRRAVAVDLGPTPLLMGRWSRPEAEFVAVDSHSGAFRRLLAARGPFDLALIDGDHSEAGVRRDFEAVRGHARILAFHDIVQDGFPGVGTVWREVRRDHADEYRFEEFTAQYPELPGTRLGIGLAVRR
jgi:hypothetical protein